MFPPAWTGKAKVLVFYFQDTAGEIYFSICIKPLPVKKVQKPFVKGIYLYPTFLLCMLDGVGLDSSNSNRHSNISFRSSLLLAFYANSVSRLLSWLIREVLVLPVRLWYLLISPLGIPKMNKNTDFPF